MAYETLNKLKWTGWLSGCSVTIRHRGAPDDEKVVTGRSITEVKKGHFMYMDSKTGEETYIPMHRILKIMVQGKVLWEKKRL